jgi:hypothetical protein
MPKSVKEGYDALVEVFECMNSFVRRLMVHIELEEHTLTMAEVAIKIMVELISVLALATKQINEGNLSKSPLSKSPMTYILLRNMRRNF